MTTVAIMGAGELGGAVAHGLAARDAVDRVILIDAAAGIAAGKALDIQQAGAIAGFHATLAGTDDHTRVAGCAACVIADRAGPPSSEWQGDEGLALVDRLAPYIGQAPLVFAGRSQAGLMLAVSREGHLHRARLIGSASEAYGSAMRAIVAMEAGCSATEVALTVLGVPPAGLVIPWSDASIGGLALERVLSQVQLARVQAWAGKVWPPGPYALGLAAAGVVEAMMRASRRTSSVLSVLDGEFGVRGRVGALPALLISTGIARTHAPVLNTRERVQVETALGG